MREKHFLITRILNAFFGIRPFFVANLLNDNQSFFNAVFHKRINRSIRNVPVDALERCQ